MQDRQGVDIGCVCGYLAPLTDEHFLKNVLTFEHVLKKVLTYEHVLKNVLPRSSQQSECFCGVHCFKNSLFWLREIQKNNDSEVRGR